MDISKINVIVPRECWTDGETGFDLFSWADYLKMDREDINSRTNMIGSFDLERPDQDSCIGTIRVETSYRESPWDDLYESQSTFQLTGTVINGSIFVKIEDIKPASSGPISLTASEVKEEKLTGWLLASKFEVIEKTKTEVPFCTVGKTVTQRTKLAPVGKCKNLEVSLVSSRDGAPGWSESHYHLAIKNVKTGWFKSWNKTSGEDVYMDDFSGGMFKFFLSAINMGKEPTIGKCQKQAIGLVFPKDGAGWKENHYDLVIKDIQSGSFTNFWRRRPRGRRLFLSGFQVRPFEWNVKIPNIQYLTSKGAHHG